MQKTPEYESAELIQGAASIAVFSGAGISVASGIPDFRSSGGLWEKFDPSVCADYQGFLTDPRPFWEMAYACDGLLAGAKPNAAHSSLATLEHTYGKRMTIITQNIDALHTEAGSSLVYEVHGSFKSGSCISCRALGDETAFTLEEIREMMRPEAGQQDEQEDTDNRSAPAVRIPSCPKCGSTQMKTDVIMFGEDLPDGIMAKSIQAVQSSDLCIVIGSSLEVSPANMIPAMAKQAGAKLLFFNKDPTAMDQLADVCVREPVEIALPAVLAQLKEA